jgi:hypothetical protein
MPQRYPDPDRGHLLGTVGQYFIVGTRLRLPRRRARLGKPPGSVVARIAVDIGILIQEPQPSLRVAAAVMAPMGGKQAHGAVGTESRRRTAAFPSGMVKI